MHCGLTGKVRQGRWKDERMEGEEQGGRDRLRGHLSY